EQLVVLRYAVRTGRCARLDLASVRSDCDVSDRAVFALAGTVGDNRRVACALRHFDRVERFRQRTELVNLNEDRVAGAFLDACGQTLRVRYAPSVAYELHSVPKRLGEQLPTFPVVFGAAVFDRDDRVLVDPRSQQVYEFSR